MNYGIEYAIFRFHNFLNKPAQSSLHLYNDFKVTSHYIISVQSTIANSAHVLDRKAVVTQYIIRFVYFRTPQYYFALAKRK